MSAPHTVEILPQTNDSTTGFVDFLVPDWANAVMVHVKCTDRLAAASFVFTLAQLSPDGVAMPGLSSAAIVTNSTFQLTIAPGIAAVANLHAMDVLVGKARLSWVAGAGTYDLQAWATFSHV